MEIFNNTWVVVLITLAVLFVTYVIIKTFVIHSFFWSEVDRLKLLIGQTGPSLIWLEREHGRCAWNESGKPDPYRLVALRELIQKEKEVTDPFDRNMALSSDMYGQVKYLIRAFQFPMAVFMWWRHLVHREVALNYRSGDTLSPIEMEVVGAKYFALATRPIIGWFFKERAKKILDDAYVKLVAMAREGGFDLYTFILHKSIIYSKLFVLTNNEYFKLEMKHVGFNGEHEKRDRNQMERIRKHFGFRTIEEFMEYCEDK